MANTKICLNGDCLTVNSIDSKFCEKCGEKVLLKDRYQAIKLIGQGGFGRTFLAQDLDKPSQPFCVIKQFFPTAQGTDNLEKASQLFAQEAIRLEHLGKHPQIPELFAYFVTDDQQEYLVQEYIAGQNLEAELKSQGVYDENKVKDLLIDVLKILQFIHKNQVIHRDIKPENIIRREGDGKLVLVDFGASKLIASPTALNVTGTVIGSAQYWSPEQSRGKPVFASDLYSLGVTCLYLLTNVDPFQLFDINENDWVWRDHLKDNSVSDDLAEVLDKLITVGLKKRFQSVDEVLEALNYNQPDEPAIQEEPLLTYIQFPPIKTINKPKTEKVEFSSVTIVKRGEQWITYHSQCSCILTTFHLGNEVNLEMVSVLGGTFNMGSNECDVEQPVHTVKIQPFLMSRYTITQAQYQIIMGDNPSGSQGDNLPVYSVSWLMAQDFCEKLSKQVGKKFYLPSESQWEYACRAGTSTAFSFGGMITGNLANYHSGYSYKEGPKGSSRGKVMDVGSFYANNFGLYDMHGNVWEWCQDGWHENYLAAPNDGSAWVKAPINDTEKVMRGGSYHTEPDQCRSAYRRKFSLSQKNNGSIGFRVCCDVDLSEEK